MAIYHFSAKVIGRAAGRSAVAAAAYRSGSRLRDERLDRDHDFAIGHRPFRGDVA
jgi:MobA/MobL family